MDDLERALSFFNKSGRSTADAVVRCLKQGKAPGLLADIETALEARLDDADFYPEASSVIAFESEPVSAALQNLELDPGSQAIVIAADDHTVPLHSLFRPSWRLRPSFTFTLMTPLTEMMSHWLNKSYGERRIVFELAITAERDLEPEPSAINVEVAKVALKLILALLSLFAMKTPTTRSTKDALV